MYLNYILSPPTPPPPPKCSRLQDLRHGQGRLHFQRRAVHRAQNDGGQQPEGRAAAADRRQNHHLRGRRRRRKDLIRRVLFGECLAVGRVGGLVGVGSEGKGRG